MKSSPRFDPHSPQSEVRWERGLLPAALTRRRFLSRSLGWVGGASAMNWMPRVGLGAGGQVPANERIGIGLIGVGTMGSGHLRRVLGDPGMQLVAVCDVDTVRREAAREAADAHYAAQRPEDPPRCVGYTDYRALLERADVDAVIIVTPDHWHALQSIDAAKAGKDVYCEKPISLTIQEGRAVVETVQRYGRVFQTGTQYRSIPTIRQICSFIREGGLGRVRSVFALFNTLEGWIRSERCRPYASVLDPDVMGRSYVPLDFPLPGEPVPEGLDWELWVGPAPWRPYNPLYHVNPKPGVVPWAFADAFGATSLTWHLAHSADVIQYAIGMERSGPVELFPAGQGGYPTLTCRYGNGVLLHLVDHWGQVKTLYHAVPGEARLAGNFGGVFVGDEGWVTTLTTGGPVEGQPEALLESIGLRTREVNPGANNHHANWLECIRSRATPSCDEEIGHSSAALGHLANITCRTQQTLRWDPAGERFVESDAANRLRGRAMRAPWRI